MAAKRESTHINGTVVNRALRLARDGKAYEITDTTVKRLSISTEGGVAKWRFRFRLAEKQTTRTIADVDQIRDPDKVRALARRAKEMGLLGEDPAPLFEAARREGSGDLEKAETEKARAAGEVWTWEQLRDAFIQDTLENKRSNTYRSYKSVLNQPDFDRFEGKLITKIEGSHLRAVRKSMVDRGVKTQSKSAVRAAKAAFSWALEQEESGLKVNLLADVKAEARAVSTKPEDEPTDGSDNGEDNGGRTMTDEQLGSMPWALEDHHNASGRLAAMLLLTTVQRRMTVISARKKDFRRDEETGFMVWKIPASLAKGSRPHEVPLTPLAVQAYEGALAISRRTSPWLFPQQRLRRAGAEGGKHMNERTLSQIFYDLQDGGGMKCHADGELVSTHDPRSTFTTYLRDTFRTPEQDIAKVLAHSEGKGQSVTSKHYDRAKELRLKYELLSLWEARLLELMNKHAPEDAKAAFG